MKPMVPYCVKVMNGDRNQFKAIITLLFRKGFIGGTYYLRLLERNKNANAVFVMGDYDKYDKVEKALVENIGHGYTAYALEMQLKEADNEKQD